MKTIHKSIILFSASLFIALPACNLLFNSEEDSLEQAGLKGPISSLQHQVFEAEFKFGEWSAGIPVVHYTFDASETDYDAVKYTFLYDEQGLLIDEKYDRYRAIRVYNEDNKLVERNCYNDSGDPMFYIEFEYNDEGLLVEKLQSGSKGNMLERVEYNYEDEMLVRKKFFNYNDVESYHLVYEYDNKGRLLSQSKIIVASGEKSSITSYTYNEDGELLSKSDSSSLSSKEILFDEVRLPKKETQRLKDGSVNHIYLYEHEFDTQENWIKRIISEDDEPQFVVTREIIYYEK